MSHVNSYLCDEIWKGFVTVAPHDSLAPSPVDDPLHRDMTATGSKKASQ